MKRFVFNLSKSALSALLLCLLVTTPTLIHAQSAVKMKNLEGTLNYSTPIPVMTLKGTASHLGQFLAQGEVAFSPGAEAGAVVGSGPVVFQAANGDLLVGNMNWTVSGPESNGSRTSEVHFRWSDSIKLANGVVVTNTGRFVRSRPPGLVVVMTVEEQNRAILIAILKAIFGR